MYMFVHGYVMIYPDVDIDIRFPPASNLPSCDPGAVVPRTSITSDIYIYIYNYICVCLSYDPFDSSSFGYPRVVKQFDPENSICSKLILMARSMLGFGYLGIVTRYFESNCHGKIPRQDLAIECDSCSWPIFQRGTGPRKSVKADKDGQR